MNNKPGSDNKGYQIIMVVITTIVAPLTVFFITSNAKKDPSNTTPPPAITAPAQAAIGTDQPVATAKTETTAKVDVTAQPTVTLSGEPTPAGVSNPTGLLPAGAAALVDNLSLSIDTQDIQIDGDYIRLQIHVRNLGSSRRTLVYTPGSITVKDSAGKTYETFFGEQKTRCRKSDLTASKKVQIDPGAELTLLSPAPADSALWCSDDKNGYIPVYMGPIAAGVKSLRIGINGLGPFEDFEVEVGL